MSAAEWRQWRILYAREPFGHLRDDLSAAMIRSTIVNANPYRRGAAIKAADLVVDWGWRDLLPPGDDPADDAMRERFMALVKGRRDEEEARG